MAKRVAEMEAVINLRFDDKDSMKQMEGQLKSFSKISNKGLNLEVRCLGDDIIEVQNILNKLKKDGKTAFQIDFDANSFLEQFQDAKNEVKEFSDLIYSIFTSLQNGFLNNVDFEKLLDIKDNISDIKELSKEIDSFQKKIDPLKKRIAITTKAKSNIAELFENVMQKDKVGNVIPKVNDDHKKDVAKLAAISNIYDKGMKNAFSNDLTLSIDLTDSESDIGEMEITFDKIQNIVDKYIEDKKISTSDIKAAEKEWKEALKKSFDIKQIRFVDNDTYSSISGSLGELQDELDERLETLKQRKAELESIFPAIQKQVNTGFVKKETTISKDKEPFESQEIVKIRIIPSNLEEFYYKISNHKIADIQITPRSDDLDKFISKIQKNIKNKPVNIKLKTDGKADLVNTITGAYKNLKDKNEMELISQVRQLSSKGSGKNNLNKEDTASLVVALDLLAQIEDKSRSIEEIFKTYTKIPIDSITKQFSNIKKQYDVIKDDIGLISDDNSGKVALSPTLEVTQEEITKVKRTIESGINPISITFDAKKLQSLIQSLKNIKVGEKEESKSKPKALTDKQIKSLDKTKEAVNNLNNVDLGGFVSKVSDSFVQTEKVIANFIDKINELKTTLENLGLTSVKDITSKELANSLKSQIKELQDTAKQRQKEIDNLTKQNAELRKAESKGNSPTKPKLDASQMQEQIKKIQDDFKGADVKLGNISISDTGIASFTAELKNTDGVLQKINVKIKNIQSITRELTKDDLFANATKVGSFDKDLDKLQKSLDTLDKFSNIQGKSFSDKILVSVNDKKDDGNKEYLSAKAAYEQTKQKALRIADKGKDLISSDEIDKLSEYIKLLNQLNTSMYRTEFKQGQGRTKRNRKFDLVESLKKVNSDTIREFYEKEFSNLQDFSFNEKTGKGSFKTIEGNAIRSFTIEMQKLEDAANDGKYALVDFESAEKRYLSTTEQWANGIGKKIANLTQYVTGIEVVMRAWNQMKAGYSFVKELNSQLTTINQTMSTSNSELTKLGINAIGVAKELHTNAQNVLQATAIYANANETAESILNKAKPTIMLANASQSDATIAADQIQGVVNQFTELEGQERRIVNSYEKISSEIAVDFANGIGIIAEGTQNAGLYASEAGLEFEEFASSVAKVAEITRSDGSQISNAMKTIMARTSRSKTADENVTDEERSNAAKALSSIGISVYNQNGEYQDFSKTLDELAAKWDVLTDAQKNYIAEQMAGVRNVNVFNAMIKSWDDAKKIAKDALTDTNFIDETQEKYEKSLIAKNAQLQAGMQEFWASLLDANLLGGAVSIVSEIVGLGSDILNIVGLIVSPVKLIDEELGNSASALVKLVATATLLYNIVQGIEAKKTGKTFKEGFMSGFDNIKGFVAAGKDIFKNMASGFVKGTSTVDKFKGAIQGANTSLGKLAPTVKGIGIGLAIWGAFKVFETINDSIKTTDELLSEASKASEEYQNKLSLLANSKQEIDSLSNEYEQLSRGVNIYGENIGLTSDEFDRYHEICNQLADIFPEMVNYYDEQGNAVLRLKGNVEALNDAYEKQRLEVIKENRENNADTYLKNYNNLVNRNGFFDEIKNGAFDEYEKLETLNKVKSLSYEQFINGANGSGISYTYLKNEFGLSHLDTQENREIWKTFSKDLESNIEQIENTLSDASSHLRQLMREYVQELVINEQIDLSSSQISQINKLIDGISETRMRELSSDEDVDILNDYIKNMATSIQDNQKVSISLNELLSIDENTDLDEIKKIINDKLGILATELGEDRNELKIQLGIEDKLELLNEYDQLVDDIAKKSFGITQDTKWDRTTKSISRNSEEIASDYAKIRNFIKENSINTKQELDLLRSCVTTTNDWADAQNKYNLLSSSVNGAALLEDLKANLSSVTETMDKFNEAIDASYKSTGMTGEQVKEIVDAFSDLEDGNFDYDKLFESTAEGIQLNAQELNRLTQEYEKFEKEKYDKAINDLVEKYENACLSINNTASATSKLQAIQERDTLKKQIKEAQELQAQYEGLTSAVTQYFNAADGSEESDDYVNLQSQLEDMQNLRDQGKVGTNQFARFVDMLSFDDVNFNDYDEMVRIYDKKISEINKLFTEGSSGAEYFVDRLNALGYATQDDNGRWIINGELEDMAKSLDLDVSLVDLLFKNLSDYGFDIKITEPLEFLDNLRGSAEDATKALNELDEKYDINLDVSGDELKKSKQQIENWLATLDDSDKEAKQHLENINSYFEAKIGQSFNYPVDLSLNYAKDATQLENDLKKIKESNINFEVPINFETNNLNNIDAQIDAVEKTLDNFKDKTGNINLEINGAQETANVLMALTNQKIALERPAVIKLDPSDYYNASNTVYTDTLDKLQQLQVLAEDIARLDANASMGIDVSADKEAIQKQISEITSNFSDNELELLAKLNINPSSLSAGYIKEELNKLSSEVMIEAGFKLTAEAQSTLDDVENPIETEITVDDTAARSVVESLREDAEAPMNTNWYINGKEQILQDNKEIRNEVSKPITTKQYIERILTGASNIGTKVKETSSGSAQAQGNASSVFSKVRAFASGTIGAAKTGISLVGELGRELVVRGNSFFTVGDNGPSMEMIKKNDIIFNHQQTEELLKNGKTHGRGKVAGGYKAFVKGIAYASGVGNDNYSTQGGFYGSGNKFYSNNNNSKSGKELDEFLEKMDWIVVKIDRIEREIERLDTIANSAYKSFNKRNTTLIQEFSKVTEEIKIQQQAYTRYMKEAESVGLRSDYARKVREGKIDIETITDESLNEKIQEYQKWFEAAIECRDAIINLEEKLGDITKAKFDNIVSVYDYQLSEIESRLDNINTGLDIVEAKGQFAGKSYFDTLINVESQNINKLSQMYSSLQKEYQDAMNTGYLQAGSEAAMDMEQEIREVSTAWHEAQLNLLEYQNQMREMDWSVFEKGLEYISEITAESSFIRDLLSMNENDLFNKESGNLNTYGQTVGSLHAMDFNVYMAQADEYRKKVEELNKEIAQDPTNTILIDKRNEYLKLQQDSIKAANDEKLAVRDLIEESYNRMLEILQELIDKRKELLNSQKDLYDYERNISEQTKNLADLRKQWNAVQGDDSESGQKKRQELSSSIKEAEKNLEADEYDRWLQDQEQLLDKLYADYEEVLMDRLDNIDGLFLEMIENTNTNSSMINDTINQATGNVGYQITEGMQGIWDSANNNMSNVVSDYKEHFTNTMTTTNNYILSCSNLLAEIVKKADNQLKQNTSPTPPSPSTSNANKGTSNSIKTNTKPTSSSTNNKTNNNSNKNKGSFFVFKKDYFEKSKLNVETSIVDRLKYHDFDPSFKYVKQYYEAMGLGKSNDYRGTFNQNVAMLNWMKKNGFSTGGQIGGLINKTGDDGFILAKEGEHVLTARDWQFASNMAESLIDFGKLSSNANNLNKTIGNTINGVTFQFVLNGVNNPDDFLRILKTNKNVRNALVDLTVGQMLGKNSLTINKYK